MPLEGDARSERQSSADASPLATLLAALRRFARPAFAAFVLLHLTCQACRAFAGGGGRAEPGLELRPWFVASVLLIVWLPFTSLALHALRRQVSSASTPARTEQARALAVAEQLALLVVALFTVVHVAETAWPLLRGELTASDLQPELILLLSSTSRGVPLHAVGYLCGVGAAAFYATRLALGMLGRRPALERSIVLLGVLAYLLGSYAVIRCAGGAIFS